MDFVIEGSLIGVIEERKKAYKFKEGEMYNKVLSKYIRFCEGLVLDSQHIQKDLNYRTNCYLEWKNRKKGPD